jgi:uncharacterized protein YbjQ (UPF0145 family)
MVFDDLEQWLPVVAFLGGSSFCPVITTEDVMRAIAFSLLALAALLLAPTAASANMITLPLDDAMSQPEAESRLGDDIQFFFGDEEHPAVAESFGTRVTNKKTNAFNKEDAEACNWVFLSAILQLQETARSLGADAVINIESYYDRNAFRSETEFECEAGAIMAGVALRGEFVELE